MVLGIFLRVVNLQTHRPVDVALAVAICVSAALAAIAGIGWLRLLTAPIAVLAVPGYLLTAIIFPGRHEPSGEKPGVSPLERAALSVGLSLALAPVAVILANFTPWGLTTASVMVALASMSLVGAVLALRRRRSLPAEDQPLFRLAFSPPQTKMMTRLDRALLVLVVLSVASALGAGTYALTTPQEPVRFTQFYVLGPDGLAEDYPSNLLVNEEGHIVIGVHSHESRLVDYVVSVEAVRQDAEHAATPERLLLDRFEWTMEHDEQREELRSFRLQEEGHYRLELTLREVGEEQVYRSVHFDVYVMPAH